MYASSTEDASWGELFRHHLDFDLSPFEVRRRMSTLRMQNLPVLDLTEPGSSIRMIAVTGPPSAEIRAPVSYVGWPTYRVGVMGIPGGVMPPDSLFSRPVGEIASVLDSDADLLEAVAPEQREQALQASRARVLRVERGEWDAGRDAAEVRGGHGLLVLSGVVVRCVGLTDHIGGELLGPGDLLRPLEHDGELATLPFEATWRALEVLRLAILNHRWSTRMCQFPDVGIALTGRAMLRSRRLANTLVIASHPRLDERLRLLLWELADRHGVVHPDGVHLRLPLTHEGLAELAAARRPSVSTALGRLTRKGQIERRDGLWVLHGEPPGHTEVENSPEAFEQPGE